MRTVERKTHRGLVRPVNAMDHVQGSADAPLTLVEYGDYQCLDCFAARLVVAEVRVRLGESLRFVWRHFPVGTIHPLVEGAAEIAEAAAAQDRFWAMHHKLLAYQGRMSGQLLEIWARRIGIDVDRMRRELAERTYEPRVRADLDGGLASGVHATPTFFINGDRYLGRVGPDDLYAALVFRLPQANTQGSVPEFPVDGTRFSSHRPGSCSQRCSETSDVERREAFSVRGARPRRSPR